jgi:hypothetical protein
MLKKALALYSVSPPGTSKLSPCYNLSMSRQDYIRRAIIAAGILLILLRQGDAVAQDGASLRATSPNVDIFPTVSLYLSLTDSEGEHIPDLSSRNFVVLEDGKPIHGATVEEQNIGVRQVFILNTTRNMRGRDSLGLTRFDYVRRSLLEWWSRPGSSTIGIDDLSLLTDKGTIVTHTSLAAELAASLTSFEPEYRDEPATFDVLLDAIDFVADPPPRLGMPTHIIFITPLILEPEDFPLTDTIARAKDSGTRIFPILVGPEELLDYPELENLRLLANATGGEIILFSPERGLLSLAERILSQRNLYHLTYSSAANSSGIVQFQIQATDDGLDVISDPRTFSIEVSPPDVTFDLPPEKIVRESEDPNATIEMLAPSTTLLKVLINFPDGHIRPIISSSLIVDDLIVSERHAPPFEEFNWDISEYLETESHVLQVVVEDSLGLQGSTEATTINVEVILPPSGLNTLEPLIGTILPILGVLASVIIVSIVVFGYARQRATSPTASASGIRTPGGGKQRITLRPQRDQLHLEGQLVAETEGIEHVPLVGSDIILGRDSSLSAVHLDDPSVSGLHARLTRLANGEYLIRDQGSSAGTWVNYEPISEDGHILEHGDLIQLGRIMYRFTLTNVPSAKEIRVSVIKRSKP